MLKPNFSTSFLITSYKQSYKSINELMKHTNSFLTDSFDKTFGQMLIIFWFYINYVLFVLLGHSIPDKL